MSNFYTVCVGAVGAGKSTFINSILKYGNKCNLCKIGTDWKGVTKELDEKFIVIGEKKNFIFMILQD